MSLDINEIVKSKMDSLVKDGSIEKMISEKLEETVKEAISSAFRSYSDFGRGLSEKIETAIGAARHDVELPMYNKFIAENVASLFDSVMKKESINNLKSLIGEQFPPLDEKFTTNDLTNKIQECFEGDDEECSGFEVTVNEERDENSIRLTIYKEDSEDEKIRVTFYKWDRDEFWHIGYINQSSYQGNYLVNKTAQFQTHLYDQLIRFLYRAYCCKTNFDLTDSFETIYVGEHW